MSEREEFRDEIDDALEDSLRTLFADERLTIPRAPAATARVVAAARRARMRRQLAIVGGGTLAAASALVAVVLVAMPSGNGAAPVAAPPSEPTSSIFELSESPKPTERSAPPPELPSRDESTGSAKTSVNSGTRTSEPSTNPSEEFNTPKLSGGPIGPSGYGDLQLGMSFDEAKPYLAEGSGPAADCTAYSLAEGPEWVNTVQFADGKLVRITASDNGRTPEGTGFGTALEDLTAKHPDGSEQDGEYVAPSGGSGKYHFPLGEDATAKGLYLTSGAC